MKVPVIVLVLVSAASSNILSDWLVSPKKNPEWDGLRVTFGSNLFKIRSGELYSRLPRTVDEATNEKHFTKLSDCNDEGYFRGNRYWKDNDPAVVLLYDKQGYIAGIQAGVPEGQSNGFPFKDISGLFANDGGINYITAYFVDPSTICTTGRSSEEFEQTGTGTNLYIQIGKNPEKDLRLIPMEEKGMKNTKWVEGKCFPGMGKHYWYNVYADSPCESLFPAFALYDDGKLSGFGWTFSANLTSPRYEHPEYPQIKFFMKEVPSCIENIGVLSTMHVFLKSYPYTNFCLWSV